VLKAEAVKIFVVLVSLWSAFKFYTALVPFALIAGLVLSAIISGASITKLNEDK
jgi:F0F1-type ATP synthase assembly protein I